MTSHAISFLLWLVLVPATTSKRISGTVVLEPQKAKVVTKFCFDFNANCRDHNCSTKDMPGMLNFNVHDARQTPDATTAPAVFLALLDDEYFSFPEVSEVWDDNTCEELRKASKKSVKLDWKLSSSARGEDVPTPLVERLRPRWWYIAFVSCATTRLEFSYSAHLENQLWGWRKEFSRDVMNVCLLLPILMVAFATLMYVQLKSVQEWRRRSHTGKWYRLHPALILLTVGVAMGTAGQGFWCLHYWRYKDDGIGSETFIVLATTGTVVAKTILSMMLMLLAHGECVCTPDVSWHLHRELLAGFALFGLFSLLLELWGDSEFRSTTTEYIYDTRPGMVLLAFDLLWFWVYISRSFQTFRNETRLRPKRFYKTYGALFALWFASLPTVALIARCVAPWVRYGITFALTNIAHGLALALLVRAFHPNAAVHVLELKASEYSAVSMDESWEELGGTLEDADML